MRRAAPQRAIGNGSVGIGTMNYLKIILKDARGIATRCGWPVALRWLWCVLATLPACMRSHNLQPADLRMGNGPFLVSRNGARAKLAGQQVFSGIREIWVRDVYLKNDYLRISPGALVVDLGANLGNFTSLALAQHGDVRVIAVEASRSLANNIRESAVLNGWADRVAVKRAFLGLATKSQLGVAANPDYEDARYLSEREFLDEFDIRHVDFLKCDIEGSEFFLLDPSSKLLHITRNLAIEIHAWGGSVQRFLDHLRQIGFEIGVLAQDATGTCIALCKRPTVEPSVAKSQQWSGEMGRVAAG
jgi:FkbM family methyltransferase